MWKVKLGEAFVKSSSGEKYEIKSGDSVTFSPQKAISIYVPDSLEVFKTYLDADHKQEIKENQQINYHILDIIFISLGIYKECQDGLLTQGYKIEEIVCYGKKGNISQAINDEKRLDEVTSLINKHFGISKDILLGKTRIMTGLYCTDLNFEATYGYDGTKPKSIDTMNVTREIEISELIENPLLLDYEKNIKMIDSNVYSLENLIKLKILSILKENKLSRGLGFSFVIDEEMIPYLSKMQLPKYAKYSKKLETIILNIINARL